MAQGKSLEYFPFSSSVNPSFWHKFTEIKLDIDKLNENDRKIWGYYSNLTFNSCRTPLFEVDSTSFNKDCTGQNTYLPAHGVLLNKNTIEQFKDCDKNEVILSQSKVVWDCIRSGEAADKPFLLNFFFILSYADLKKYHYYYWFCFPTLSKINVEVLKTATINNVFDKMLITKLDGGYNQLQQEDKPFFIVKSCGNDLEVLKLSCINSFDRSTNLEEFYFAFSDPSASPEHPGWPVRNFIAFLLYTCPFLCESTINILAFRLTRDGNVVNNSNSIIFTITLPALNIETLEHAWIGWEKNERGKFGPRLSNMKNSMDPKCLAETAVDLNLKLMKWQLLPNIDLEIIKKTKCLLLGSGTLGCSVARTLLGWGVRNITFVDNAFVSFSNPVRQTLFVYEDCLKNRTKAEAAADSLKKIFPGVNSKGYHLTIPMPGHPVGQSLLSQTEESVQTLSELISEHDIIFLLMDSRESRWLPTLLGTFYKKIVINAALGFDTYLIMRHGFRSSNIDEATPGPSITPPNLLRSIPGHKLGCYFCNDVTAPGNSLKDRTLDQQCTVTRPGVSAIAGALAVELAVSILQHPDGPNASAFYRIGVQDIGNEEREDCILGILPHSIRGFLSTYNHVLPATEKYKQCVACSDKIVEEYEKNGFEFLLKVFDSCKYLEELTGLTEIQNEITDLEVWDLEDTTDDSE